MAQLESGMKVRSIAGETGKTCASDSTFTGPNALGYVDEVIEPEDGIEGASPIYVVTFENDVTVHIGEEAIFDAQRYTVLY